MSQTLAKRKELKHQLGLINYLKVVFYLEIFLGDVRCSIALKFNEGDKISVATNALIEELKLFSNLL